uniref:Calpain catalytic domain-containing protein n=1 Tax=Oreochromis niloticus TaxID=8128 RepID=A0A669F087_ORENI
MPLPGACLNIMEARHKQKGYGSISNPERFFNQDFKNLKQYCLIKGVRYLDDMFPPDAKSIGQGILKPSELAHVMWLRPAQIAPDAEFVVDGYSRFDFGQGVLGNCWFLASIGALTFQNHIFQQVVPLDQKIKENYCGIFHFRFWRFGRWVDVVIDDKLPTINGRLIFVHSKDPNEFWPALLEKAYAKVCGSYTDMTSGTPSEAMMDFTGGVHVCVQLSDTSSDVWGLICRAGKSNTLMGCGTPQGETSANTVLPNGLVQGHAYTVTGVKEVKNYTFVKLIRLWNPWGKGEWVGDWSDRSPMWDTVSSQDRQMCLSVADDGEFWMAIEDFCKFYTDLDICGLKPDFIDGKSSAQWKTSVYEGRWVAGTTAGGCINNRDTFWTNPQYRIKVVGENSETNEKNILVSLMQKPDKRNRRLVQNLHIGFAVYLYKTQSGKFPAMFFNTHLPVARSDKYMNAREVIEFLMLKPGEYLIVPSTFKPNETASFILTIHSREETYMKSGGFSLDACRSMVALMDVSCYNTCDTGKTRLRNFVVCLFELLKSNSESFKLLLKSDCVCSSGMKVADDMLSLMALRYGASSGHMTLECFISLMIRLDCMKSK